MEADEQPLKHCKRCDKDKPATPDFWYVQRAREGHKEGLQSNCRECWKDINKENKARIRQKS